MRDLLFGSLISETHLPHVRMRTPLYTLAFRGEDLASQVESLGTFNNDVDDDDDDDDDVDFF